MLSSQQPAGAYSVLPQPRRRSLPPLLKLPGRSHLWLTRDAVWAGAGSRLLIGLRDGRCVQELLWAEKLPAIGGAGQLSVEVCLPGIPTLASRTELVEIVTFRDISWVTLSLFH